MARRHYLRTALAGTLALSLIMPAVSSANAAEAMKSETSESEYSAKAEALVKNAQYTVEKFSKDDEIAWVHENIGKVKGVMIVPQEVKGGFILGGSGGNGVLLARDGDKWSAPAFYTLGSVTFGFQAGAEVSEIVLLVMTDKGMDALKSTDVKLGGEISVAAGPVGAGAQAQTADIIAFSRSKGLYGGLNLEGAVVQPRSGWNAAYYGHEITPSAILAGEGTGIGKASELRAAVAGLDLTASSAATGSIAPTPSEPMTDSTTNQP